MRAITVSDQAAGTSGMSLVERPNPQAAIAIVEIHASGFVSTELAWPSTWTIAPDSVGTVSPLPRSKARRHRI